MFIETTPATFMCYLIYRNNIYYRQQQKQQLNSYIHIQQMIATQ